MTSERRIWVDRAKGILITLVVVGHVLGATCHISKGHIAGVMSDVRNLIYLFHMPAFFVLAGIVWHRNELGFVLFLKKKAIRLLLPYVVYGFLSVCLYAMVFGGGTFLQSLVSLVHAGGWPNGEGFRYNSVLWFLPVMFIVLVSWYWIDRVVGGGGWRVFKLMVIIIVLLSLRFAAYRYRIWYWPWGVISALWFLPFVMIGNVLHDITHVRGKLRPWQRIIVFLMGVIVFAILDFMRIVDHCDLMQWSGFVCHIVCALFGSIFCFALAQDCFLSRLSCISVLFAKLGEMSMGIMLVHQFFAYGMQNHLAYMRNIFTGNCLSVIFGVVAVTIVSILASSLTTLIVRRVVPILKI